MQTKLKAIENNAETAESAIRKALALLNDVPAFTEGHEVLLDVKIVLMSWLEGRQPRFDDLTY